MMKEPHTITDLHELDGLSPIERSRLFLGNHDLLATVAEVESDERLVHTPELINRGFIVHPYWSADSDEVEGRSYQAYIERHPNFDLALREGVVDRLEIAQSKLPENWQMVLKAGYRPPSVQQQVFESAKLYLHLKHPEWSDPKLLANARILVSDPSVKVPPHCTGAAVDIELANKITGKLIDVGARANTEGPAGWSYSPVISKQQQQKRLVLLEAMLDAGFSNFAYEWWHFSYGDQMWALFYGKRPAIYTIIPDGSF